MNSASDKIFNSHPPSVVILAGGESARMGFPKLLLQYNQGQTFVEQIVSVYRLVTNIIVLVLNDEVYKKNESFFSERLGGVTIIPNPNPEYGRTQSVQLGLEKVNSEKLFIQNTDNPFVKKELLQEMISVAPDNGYVSPKVKGKGGHPVLLCSSTIEKVRKAEKEKTLKEILSSENRIDLKTNDETVLLSIDTPEIYKAYFPENSDFIFEKNYSHS